MSPIAIALTAWLLGSVPTALVVGRVVRRADAAPLAAFTVPDHIPADVLASVDLPHRT